MKLWTVGVKVADLENEIKFLTSIGGELVIDDVVNSGGKTYRAPLVRLGDKFVHVLGHTVYEDQLETTLPFGLVHLVYAVNNLVTARERALAAGAEELLPPHAVSAGFGSREVATYRSPGGLIFELIQIHDNGVLGQSS